MKLNPAGRLVLIAMSLGIPVLRAAESTTPLPGPEYTSDRQLKYPENYREWVFLSSGVGMTYGPLAPTLQQGPPLFDNVFVNPAAYRSFLETGKWPDKTVFILEIRASESHASINNGGHFQRDLVGIEAEVKDRSAVTGEWTFYGFPVVAGKASGPARAFPGTASCYSCHGRNTAVENTFVQFYPVLYDVAGHHGTIKPGFVRLPLTTGQLAELLTTQGWTKTEPVLIDTAQRSPDAAVLLEPSLNRVGTQLLQAKKTADAIGILEWTAARHPQSANAQDSLAEAYATAGNKDAARAATRHALELADLDPGLPRERKEQLKQAARDRLARLQ